MTSSRHINGPRADGILIDDEAGLANLCRQLESADLVAVDTEFVREKTYYPELCLIQVASDAHLACIDCLAELDLAPFFGVVLAPRVSWVLHSARQDLEVVWNETGRLPARLIDTQIAAALLGYPPQLSLQTLLAEIVGVELDKSQARSDWTRRPLPRKALDYAFDDVRHLLAVWRELGARLDARGRLAWHEEDCRRALATPLAPDPVGVWLRLRGLAALSDAERAAALGVVAWREQTAERANRPRRWILGDDVVMRIAKAMPRELDGLEAAGVPPRLLARAGKELLDAVRKSARPSIRETAGAFRPPPKPDKARLGALQARAAARARELGIETEVLATRRDLAALANDDPPDVLKSGWRAEQLGVETL